MWLLILGTVSGVRRVRCYPYRISGPNLIRVRNREFVIAGTNGRTDTTISRLEIIGGKAYVYEGKIAPNALSVVRVFQITETGGTELTGETITVPVSSSGSYYIAANDKYLFLNNPSNDNILTYSLATRAAEAAFNVIDPSNVGNVVSIGATGDIVICSTKPGVTHLLSHPPA